MMRRYNIPVAPVLIAVVLGPMAETELRRALAVSEGDVSVLISSPFTITVYLLLGIAMRSPSSSTSAAAPARSPMSPPRPHP
ncbi:hypothetical protein B841_09500 [Corynebacterium maris DSM 45190]|uniref:Uncharacterized protein n=1 Tax=Corynebacterium maris DSM 45190 TaxID=1224163 RepID=S5TKZ0_9CORY|nr:hypothetical protein [Corynebacterium maris]AGS35373.1 hypothetical protein B841_09500 [Corynebacterium maris DSM 45190]